MKSLGERLVAGLKNWRSRKKSALPDEVVDADPATSQSPEQLDHILPTRLSTKVTAKYPDEENDKTMGRVELADFPEMFSPVEEPQPSQEAPNEVEPERKERTDEILVSPPVLKSPQKQPRARKPGAKAEDGPVTDEELEELEAENARLRLLLNERLKAKQDGSEN